MPRRKLEHAQHLARWPTVDADLSRYISETPPSLAGISDRRFVINADLIIYHIINSTNLLLINRKSEAVLASIGPGGLGRLGHICKTRCLKQLAPEFPCLAQDPTCICSNANLTSVFENCIMGHCTIKESLTAKRISEKSCGHLERDRTSLILISGVVGFAVSFTAFLLRMISKLPYFGGQFHSDDWAISVSMVFGIPLGILAVTLANAGLGKDIWNVPFDDITYILKIYYVQEVMYFATINITKVSILFFYLRIFPYQNFRIASWIVMGITIAYCLALILAALFQCTPVDMAWKNWDGEHQSARCSNINLISWISAAVNIVLDVVIIAMPAWELFGLSLSMKKKLQILLMFGDHVPAGYWSTIEGHASILCACMPAIRALLRKIFPSLFGDRTGASSNGTRGARNNGGNYIVNNGGGRVFSSNAAGPQSPCSPDVRSSLGKDGQVFSESDIFPLVERGDLGPELGFGSYTVIRSDNNR
ncbi:hypothetical protein GX48_06632 [Paracoccidioides brasiliensis]|nr:hypothetical protein GX48_06632 [Paracoccidioides brasiliensis]